MNVAPIACNTSFGAKLEMSPVYQKRLYETSRISILRESSKKNIENSIRTIENSPIDDTYRLENIFDIKVRLLNNGLPKRIISPYTVVYKNGERAGIFPGREEGFIKCFAKNLELREKYPDAFKKLNMDEADIIRVSTETPVSSEKDLGKALDMIQKSKKNKEYSVYSERKSVNIFADRDNVLLNKKGKIIKKRECAMADFIVYVANKYFKKSYFKGS